VSDFDTVVSENEHLIQKTGTLFYLNVPAVSSLELSFTTMSANTLGLFISISFIVIDNATWRVSRRRPFKVTG